MRHVKTALGLAVAVCLIGALAVPALGHEFVASKYKHVISEAEPVKTAGKNVEETKTVFLFGKFKLKCEKALAKGLITEPTSTTLSTKVQYAKCGFYPFSNGEEHVPATIKGGIGYKLKVNGAAELEGNESGEEFEYGTKAELLETSAVFSIPAGKFCTIIVPTQVVPARAIKHPEEEFNFVKYSNDPVAVENTPTNLKLYPGLFKHKIIVSLDLKQIKFRFLEESQCGEDEAVIEHPNGMISGELVEEVVGGNLEFK